MGIILATREEEYKKLIDYTHLPQHIAIIMDGNRRWAKENKVPSLMGHKAGARALKNTVKKCAEIGVKVLTAYAFSKENWRRPKEEVDTLLLLFEYYIKKERESLHNNNVRFKILGCLEEMPARLQREFYKTIELTENNTGLMFNLAVNYGARTEWVKVVKTIADKVINGEMRIDNITEDSISEHLYTHGLPDPDLLIRTSGEQRISNFLLWQLAYTELVFSSVYWPDFSPSDLFMAIVEYQKRERRFGGN